MMKPFPYCYVLLTERIGDYKQCVDLASYPGLLTPAFVTCNTNTEEGLVKLISWNGVPGCVETFPKKKQNTSESATDRKHRP